MRWFWKLFWRLKGWSTQGKIPYDVPKLLLLVGPHTSWMDFVHGLAARSILKLSHIRFIGKKELFDGPFGWFFYAAGGKPVDRKSSQGVVGEVVQHFDANTQFWLAMAPEGTRKKVEGLRTGFYHIATEAKVPILLIGMDYEKKKLIIDKPYILTGDQEKDFEYIYSFFGDIKGAFPQQDLRHLKPLRKF